MTRQAAGPVEEIARLARRGRSQRAARQPPTQSTSSSPRQQSDRILPAVKLDCLKSAMTHRSRPFAVCTGLAAFATGTSDGRNNVEIGVDMEKPAPGYFSGRRLGLDRVGAGSTPAPGPNTPVAHDGP